MNVDWVRTFKRDDYRDVICREEGYEEGFEEGFEEGYEEAFKEGVVRADYEHMCSMRKHGLTDAQIEEIIGSPVAVIVEAYNTLVSKRE